VETHREKKKGPFKPDKEKKEFLQFVGRRGDEQKKAVSDLQRT